MDIHDLADRVEGSENVKTEPCRFESCSSHQREIEPPSEDVIKIGEGSLLPEHESSLFGPLA